ncbi:MAG TPA: hypothetical protein PLP19_03570 [bacterium]|nr:hypothetical protein [bacterium]HPN42548.1 hypothetical protein [bacterium]
MRLELKRFEIWSVVKIVFLISLIIGFIISLLYAGFFVVMGTFIGAIGGEDLTPMMPSSGLVYIMILVFGTMGIAVAYTIGAVVFISIYNLFSRFTGGIVVNADKLETKETKNPSSYIVEKELA